MPSRPPLRVLLVEDRAADEELVVHALRKASFKIDWKRVETEADYLAEIGREYDVILCDFNLGQFGAVRAMEINREHGVEIPLIVITGSIGDEDAVECIKRGAADYVLKDRPARLGPAVEQALKASRLRREKLAAEAALLVGEARLKLALDAGDMGAYEWNLDTGKVTWTEGHSRLWGVAPAEFDGTFDGYIKGVHRDDVEEVRKHIDTAMGSQTDYEMDHRVVWADGSVHWITAKGRFEYNPAGEAVRMTGVVMDITERKKLEEKFHQAQKMEAIGRLAGGVAHDFNNLLTAILGYSDIVLRRLHKDDPIIKDVSEIRSAGERAAGLTAQLLAFSRLQVIQPRVFNLNAAVAGIENMCRRLIGEDIDLKLTLAPDLGNIKADPGQIEQILMNLVVNARDAMAGGGKLTIETANLILDEEQIHPETAIQPGPYIMLSIADNGTGMDEETRKRIFEPFFTTKEQGKGTGLGLSTVYGIVKQSRGYIWVYSEPGRGTSFRIHLPRVEEPVELIQEKHGIDDAVCGGETILIVEDEPAVRGLAARVLRVQGYTVLEAEGGEEALKVSQEFEGRIDLLFTDLVMRGMDGAELSRELRAQRPDMRVLYMSGYTADAAGRHGIMEPGVIFLQKPFASRSVISKVREALASSAPESKCG